MCVFLQFRLNVASVTKVIVQVIFLLCFLLVDLLNFLVFFECNAILCSLQHLVSFSQEYEIKRHFILKTLYFLSFENKHQERKYWEDLMR